MLDSMIALSVLAVVGALVALPLATAWWVLLPRHARWRGLGRLLAGVLLVVLPLAPVSVALALGRTAPSPDVLVLPVALTLLASAHIRELLVGDLRAVPPPEAEGFEAALTAARVEAMARGLDVAPRLMLLDHLREGRGVWVESALRPTLWVELPVLRRLHTDLQEARLAQTLGMLSLKPGWWLACATTASALAAQLAGPIGGWALGLAGFAALRVGLWRLILRRLERRATRLALTLVDEAALLDALRAERSMEQGRLELLAGALGVRPVGLDLAGELTELAPEERRWVRAARWLARLGLLCWVLALGFGVLLGLETPLLAAGWLLLVALVPWGLERLLTSGQRRLMRRRTGVVPLPGMALLLVALGLAAGAWGLHASGQDPAGAGLALVALLVLLVALARLEAARRLREELVQLLLERRYHAALELGRRRAPLVRRDPLLRHRLALAEAHAGQRERAIEALGELLEAKPRLGAVRISLAWLLLEQQPERALELGREAMQQLPGDSWPLWVQAEALCGMGRFDEAEEVVVAALECEPESAELHAAAAAVALARIDLAEARSRLRRARRLGPLEPYVLLVAAELSLVIDPPEDARRAVEEAVAIANANPFLAQEAALARLRRRMEQD